MAETILEQAEDLTRQEIIQTIRLEDGSEVVRRISTRPVSYTCSICGAKSDRPFPQSAISCFRKECKN